MNAHRSTGPAARRRAAAAAFLLAVLTTVGLVLAPVGSATAADLSAWDPGHIISDEEFYDSTTMSAADIQAFLEVKASSCRPASDGTACLDDYRQTTNDRTADRYCPGGYVGASDERASAILAKVSQACGVNPQVLLVTLQKEQTLVTRATAGTAATYRIALGFGCPDGAPCDAQYFGFANQVYNAARQFHRYRLHPTNYSYRAGRDNFIGYHPDASRGCGGSTVFIRNQATAGLYNYTPYQPNAAALAAGYGSGNACSSYGNRNFFHFYNDWFERPEPSTLTGRLTAVEQSNHDRIRVSGWALDTRRSDALAVRIVVGGQTVDTVADRPSGSEVAGYGVGASHDVSHEVTVPPGPHRVCLLAVSPTGGANAMVGCRDVVVATGPTGAVDPVAVAVSGSGRATVSGWAFDPDSTAPVDVSVVVDGRPTVGRADRARAGLGAQWGRSDNHGFSVAVTAAPGSRRVCVVVRDTSGGPGRMLACQQVTFR